METFKQFEQEIELTGKPVTVTVEIKVGEDEYTGDFDFGDDEKNAAYLARFTSGELFNAVIAVYVHGLGIEGSDYIGSNHIHSNNYFNPALFEKDVLETVETYDMVETAIDDWKREVIDQANRLAAFATK
jgi:hypothetical protein